MKQKNILIPPAELSKKYGFPYQTMLNWSKEDGYKHTIYKILEKNMILEMNQDIVKFTDKG
ncbi:MAG: hypothetical protein QG567_2321 [Campylobacterota bacterium]|nr:hypothetical protein [Campylobacterota bacterium]